MISMKLGENDDFFFQIDPFLVLFTSTRNFAPLSSHDRQN